MSSSAAAQSISQPSAAPINVLTSQDPDFEAEDVVYPKEVIDRHHQHQPHQEPANEPDPDPLADRYVDPRRDRLRTPKAVGADTITESAKYHFAPKHK